MARPSRSRSPGALRPGPGGAHARALRRRESPSAHLLTADGLGAGGRRGRKPLLAAHAHLRARRDHRSDGRERHLPGVWAPDPTEAVGAHDQRARPAVVQAVAEPRDAPDRLAARAPDQVAVRVGEQPAHLLLDGLLAGRRPPARLRRLVVLPQPTHGAPPLVGGRRGLGRLVWLWPAARVGRRAASTSSRPRPESARVDLSRPSPRGNRRRQHTAATCGTRRTSGGAPGPIHRR
jgi:hypothetical protein